MEIVLKINGEEKVFKQDIINFKTMLMALEFQKRMDAQTEILAKTLGTKIDEEVKANADYSDLFKPGEDLIESAKLIVAFFDGQFTYDEFLKGAYFRNVSELYLMASDIFDLAFKQKQESESRQKKTQLRKT